MITIYIIFEYTLNAYFLLLIYSYYLSFNLVWKFPVWLVRYCVSSHCFKVFFEMFVKIFHYLRFIIQNIKLICFFSLLLVTYLYFEFSIHNNSAPKIGGWTSFPIFGLVIILFLSKQFTTLQYLIHVFNWVLCFLFSNLNNIVINNEISLPTINMSLVHFVFVWNCLYKLNSFVGWCFFQMLSSSLINI